MAFAHHWRSLPVPVSPIETIATTRDGRLVAIGREIGHVDLWDASQGFSRILVIIISYSEVFLFILHTNFVLGVKIHICSHFHASVSLSLSLCLVASVSDDFFFLFFLFYYIFYI
jgi:hypothetical protein